MLPPEKEGREVRIYVERNTSQWEVQMEVMVAEVVTLS
jgi:hypothetical protein